jgi:hypothetical protein
MRYAGALRYTSGVKRKSIIVKHSSGLAFRFLFDKEDPSQLHIERRWGVTPHEAVESYFAASTEPVWIEAKNCYETRSPAFILVWTWDVLDQQVFVITCIPRKVSREPEV